MLAGYLSVDDIQVIAEELQGYNEYFVKLELRRLADA